MKLIRLNFCCLFLALVFASGGPMSAAASDAKGISKGKAAAGDDLFGQLQVLPVKIEFPPASLEALKKDPRSYVRATVREGSQVYTDVGVRVKGNGSFVSLDKKPSLTLKFNEFTAGTHFHGYSKLFLDNSQEDRSYLAETIGGEIFRAAGVPAAKTTFARVEFNGRDAGLYVLAESVNRDFLSQYFKKSKGNLYEGVNSDVFDTLEKDGGDDSKDQADLKALARALREPDPAQRLTKLGPLLDVERFISFAAVEVFEWHDGGYSMERNKYRIYHDPNSGQMVFIPHGYDHIFSKPAGPLVPEWKGAVAKAIFESPEGLARFREQMTRLLTTSAPVEKLQARIAELAARIRPSLARDAAECKAFDLAVVQLRDRLAQRVRFLDEELKKAAK